jgi:hypothetical protein
MTYDPIGRLPARVIKDDLPETISCWDAIGNRDAEIALFVVLDRMYRDEMRDRRERGIEDD